MNPYFWYAGTDEEFYEIGPCLSREEVIAEALDSDVEQFEYEDENGNIKYGGFHIIEARKPDLRLSDFCSFDRIFDYANDRLADSDFVASEYDEGPWFDCTVEQAKELIALLKKTCDDWQERHNLKFTTVSFEHQRNEEYIEISKKDD